MDIKEYHLYSKYWTESPKETIPNPISKYLKKLSMYYEKISDKTTKTTTTTTTIIIIIIVIIIVIRCHNTANKWIL